MKKNILLIVIGFSLLCFSCSKNNSRDAEKKPKHSSESGIVDYSKMSRVGIVKKIDNIIQQAIRESWSKEEWVKRFGSPRRDDIYDNLEFIQYYDTGPFEDASRELVTGITIKLRGNKTFDYSYRSTSFGIPDYVKVPGPAPASK